MVIVRKSPIHGVGVFATALIPAGTFLECEVIEWESTDPEKQAYLFPYRGSSTCVHMGFASFFNGSSEPNVRHLGIDLSCDMSRFEVTRDVEIGEELTLPYGVENK